MDQATLAQWTSTIVEIIAAVFLLAMPPIVIWHRIKLGRPVANVRMIQVLALIMIVPAILIFGLAGKLGEATLGTLLAALAGMFSGIANYARRRPSQRRGTGTEDDEDEDEV
jgi:hypothetical protein